MDELAHIPAGYGYIHNFDYRLNPEHPPLVKALAMFPVLVWMYARLARQEERDAFSTFGKAYADYAARVPAFIPHLRRIPQHAA